MPDAAGRQWLRELVDIDSIQALLINRPPAVLSDPNRRQRVQTIIDGVSAEVGRITGDPPPEELQQLATWCVRLGVASKAEESLFPEQQGLGDDGRAAELRVSYLGILADLRRDSASTRSAKPMGEFPPVAPWPLSTSAPVWYPGGPYAGGRYW